MKNHPQCKDIPDEVILEACDAFHRELKQHRGADNAQTPEVRLAGVWPAKLILAKMENLHRRGLIEYGASLRTAWRKVQEPE